MKMVSRIILACLTGALLAQAANFAAQNGGCAMGTFGLTARGTLSGEGKAEIDSAEVSVHLFLRTVDGTEIRIDASDLPRRGVYFSGPAAINGRLGTVFGRLDLARASRISATFTTLDSHPIAGRFFGTFPGEAVNGEWATIMGQ